MYLRTEQKVTVELHDEDDNQPYVMPQSTTEWGLFIDKSENEYEDEDEVYDFHDTRTIATFKTVRDANSALRSLQNAIEADEGWDAIEFKKGLESGTRI